jgi:hypothetical protein
MSKLCCPRCKASWRFQDGDDEICVLCQLVEQAQEAGLYDIETNPLVIEARDR